MLPEFVRTSTWNVWNAQNALWSRAFGPSITRNLITRVLTICHVKRTRNPAPEQKRFDLPSLSPAHNLWLLLVFIQNVYPNPLFQSCNPVFPLILNSKPSPDLLVCWVLTGIKVLIRYWTCEVYWHSMPSRLNIINEFLICSKSHQLFKIASFLFRL